MTEKRIRKAFSAFLALMPIIGIYASPIPGFNIAEIIIIIFWLLFLLVKRPVIPVNTFSNSLIFFVAYICIEYMIASLFTGSNNDVLFRILRFSLYYLTVGLWTIEYFDKETFIKWMRIVVYVSVAFLLFQYAAYYLTGRIILGFVPGLRIYQQIYETADLIRKYSYYFRASAFFSEPAHLCQYFFVYLAFSLMGKDKMNLVDSIIASTGIFLSTSGQGVIIGAALWIIYVFVNTFLGEKRKSVRSITLSIVLIIGISIASVYVSQTAIFQGTIDRLMNTGEQSSRYARLNVYTYLYNDSNLFYTVFGRGFGSVPSEGVFVPALAYILYGAGIVGSLIILGLLFQSLLMSTRFGKSVTLVFCALFVIASTFMSLNGLLYLAVMQHENRVSLNAGGLKTDDGL